MKLSAEEKYHLIRQVITKYSLEDMLSHLCRIAGTSRSGYYRYFSRKGEEARKKHDELERAVEAFIHYYNNGRYQAKHKSLAPLEVRNQALAA